MVLSVLRRSQYDSLTLTCDQETPWNKRDLLLNKFNYPMKFEDLGLYRTVSRVYPGWTFLLAASVLFSDTNYIKRGVRKF